VETPTTEVRGPARTHALSPALLLLCSLSCTACSPADLATSPPPHSSVHDALRLLNPMAGLFGLLGRLRADRRRAGTISAGSAMTDEACQRVVHDGADSWQQQQLQQQQLITAAPGIRGRSSISSGSRPERAVAVAWAATGALESRPSFSARCCMTLCCLIRPGTCISYGQVMNAVLSWLLSK
jgi:hypothetical protein